MTNEHDIEVIEMLMETFAAMSKMRAPHQRKSRKPRKPVPTMVCSPPEVLAAWNADVEKRSDRSARLRGRRSARFDLSGRQAKRARYLRHPGYADRHPTLAERYA